jgi:hypothetical protein
MAINDRTTRTARRRWISRFAAASALACTVCGSSVAAADEPSVPAAEEPPATWPQRYETARKHLVAGEHRLAEQEFIALAADAPSDPERRLAIEMARIASSWAGGPEATWRALEPKPGPVPMVARVRTRDEITLLYATSFMYGVGTGAWFLLQTQPDSALTATLPFIGITAAPVLALAIIDGNAPLPHGMPHAISAGMYVGLGESILLVTYQHSRAHRTDAKRWAPEDVATVLWGGATLGGVAGAVMAVGVPTTPGRASFTASAAIWGGVLAGTTGGAFIPESGHRTEHSLLTAGIGYNVGLLGGLFTAASVAPSTTRVRLVDLSGISGAFVLGGGYAALAHGGEPRAAMALTAGGAATGLVVGWLATSGMAPDHSAGPIPAVNVQPTITPVPGGAALGFAGTM